MKSLEERRQFGPAAGYVVSISRNRRAAINRR
jgi:hypothetical protein